MIRQVRGFAARRLRNSQSGQSIILLAIGFIALAAFVGLVTDISIMFVRYATLRQAVDSAAIAAAGQVREGTSYATVALTARQYIQLHGLSPTTVWVETCETDIAAWAQEQRDNGVTNLALLEPIYYETDDEGARFWCSAWSQPSYATGRIRARRCGCAPRLPLKRPSCA
ncbi:MAG: hypothetical protein HC915_08585 [Anaerolineae bacterium]|nr:hypothetical protein [Anaerolineae bacterium]